VSKRLIIKPAGYVAIAVVLISITLITIAIFSPSDENRGARYYLNKTIGGDCRSYNQPVFSRRLKDMLPDYIGASSAAGISKCANKKELMAKVAGNELVRIRGGRGYEVEELSYSYPYLTPDGKSLLKEIGKRFRTKISGTPLRGSDFILTSMTRTTEVLLKLRKSNSNASLNSPHFHGNAFDISYIRFSSQKWFLTDCDKNYLKEALAQVIWQLREENKCWATYELKQGCFHVVAK